MVVVVTAGGGAVVVVGASGGAGPMNCPKAMGPCPTAIVAMTVSLAVSRTEIVPPTVKPQVTSAPQPLATYTRVPSGSTAMPRGDAPTGTVVTTVFVAVSTTETVPSNDVHSASAPHVFAT